jgi:hypothetical protein
MIKYNLIEHENERVGLLTVITGHEGNSRQHLVNIQSLIKCRGTVTDDGTIVLKGDRILEAKAYFAAL